MCMCVHVWAYVRDKLAKQVREMLQNINKNEKLYQLMTHINHKLLSIVTRIWDAIRHVSHPQLAVKSISVQIATGQLYKNEGPNKAHRSIKLSCRLDLGVQHNLRRQHIWTSLNIGRLVYVKSLKQFKNA